ncbi:hypothetical protein CLCR_01401 [Cladophialophora carrionii]|uniref:Uncharacterized protein n=1 Tax=Cladophialophora carrionii TaxID=86049 RepID=A0A1C1CB48_9EURO|nr:hypothetical protein CLCR_01401 [Cladophialophora carrionii]
MPLIQEVARLWAELAERRDHAFLIQEILGRVWPRSLRDSQVIDEGFLKDVVLLKTIFDVQRTRMRYDPSYSYQPSDGFLVAVDGLVDCLECLLGVAEAIARNPRISQNIRNISLNVLQQTLVSGSRASLLAIERLSNPIHSDPRVSRLEACVDRWISHGFPVGGGERSSHIFRNAIESLRGTQESESSCDEHVPLDRPDRPGFALDFNMTRCVSQAISCITGRCGQAIRSALLLLDLRLMIMAECYHQVNANTYQCESNSSLGSTSRISDTTASSHDMRMILNKWNELGTQLQDSMNTSAPDGSYPLSSFTDFADAVEPGPPSCDDPIEQILSWTGQDLSVTILAGILRIQPSVYTKICQELRLRNALVFDTHGDLQNIFSQLTAQIQSWVSRAGPREVLDSLAQHDVYILECSELHPIEYDTFMEHINGQAREALRSGQNIIDHDLYFQCPFHVSPAPYVRKARRITPLSEISRALQRILHSPAAMNDHPISAAAISDDLEFSYNEPEHIESSNRSTASRALSSNQHENATVPTTSTPVPPPDASPLLRPPTTGRATMRSRALTTLGRWINSAHNRSQSESATSPHMSELWHALSPDASNLIVWSRHRICRKPLANDTWSQEQFLDRIILAATGTTHFAAVSQGTGGYQLSLFDATGGPAGQSMMRLDKCPRSLCFSYDGSKLAVGTAYEVRIVSTSRADWAHRYRRYSLIPPSTGEELDRGPSSQSNQDSWNGQELHSQALSFSPDRQQLLVATQYGHEECTILLWLYDLRARGDRRALPPYHFRKTLSMVAPDAGLTAIPCFHRSGQTTYIFCRAAAHHRRPRVERIMPPAPGGGTRSKESEQITGTELFIDRVHTAVPISGEAPRFLLVNESNEIYLVRRIDDVRAWAAERIRVDLPRRPASEQGGGWRVSVAPFSASNITAFYIYQGQGHLVRYDASRSPREQLEHVSLDAFNPQGVDIVAEAT